MAEPDLEQAGWTDSLLTACLMLCRESTGMVTSVSVSTPRAASSAATTLARERVRRIAEEYGLRWSVHLAAGMLTARFGRASAFDR